MSIHESMRLRDILPSTNCFWHAALWEKMVANDVGSARVLDGSTGEHLGSVMVGGSLPGTLVAQRAPELSSESGCRVYVSAELHFD